MWVACEGLSDYPAEVIYQGGHRRWGIENQAFNELTQGSDLTKPSFSRQTQAQVSFRD
jgi:hypothetical protein